MSESATGVDIVENDYEEHRGFKLNFYIKDLEEKGYQLVAEVNDYHVPIGEPDPSLSSVIAQVASTTYVKKINL